MGTIVGSIDLTQVVLYGFWIFFAGLILYLRREDKREGYPLESDIPERRNQVRMVGFPDMPEPKSFQLSNGHLHHAPHSRPERANLAAEPIGNWPGAPLEPTGNPMLDGIGPAAWAEREDVPEMTLDGRPVIVPMRVDETFSVAVEDADPRGMDVYGADGVVAGQVTDLWVDRAEPQIRFLEIAVAGRPVLVPINFTRIDADRRRIRVSAILSEQFAQVPPTASRDQITKLEEDKIAGYYAGGTLYATPQRLGPLL